MRDAGLGKGVAKDVGVRAGAAGITPPETRYGEPRFELE
jgi:hypothetical protein